MTEIDNIIHNQPFLRCKVEYNLLFMSK